MKILFDSNVIIDALSAREGAAKSARELLLAVSQKQIEGYLCSKQITDIYYVLRKYYKDDSERRELIRTLLFIFAILPLDKDDLSAAILSSQSDFEDAVLSEVAKTHKLDGIVTSDKKDFLSAPIKIWSPEELSKEVA